MMNFLRKVCLVIAVALPMMATAKLVTVPDEYEERYHHLLTELRCLVCQNQNLADSNAELAKDMRHKTYELVKGGATSDDVVNYMVKRYGDFVLYRPPFKLSTLLLWLGPFAILAGGVVILIVIIRRRAKQPNAGMSDSDLKRAKVLLGEEDNN